MIVQNKHLIEVFSQKHPASAKPLKRWVEAVEGTNWKYQAELKGTFYRLIM